MENNGLRRSPSSCLLKHSPVLEEYPKPNPNLNHRTQYGDSCVTMTRVIRDDGLWEE